MYIAHPFRLAGILVHVGSELFAASILAKAADYGAMRGISGDEGLVRPAFLMGATLIVGWFA